IGIDISNQTNAILGKYRFLFLFALPQPQDGARHARVLGGVVRPVKWFVGEENLDAIGEDPGPESWHVSALIDRCRCNERQCVSVPQEAGPFAEESAYVVQVLMLCFGAKDLLHVMFLGLA